MTTTTNFKSAEEWLDDMFSKGNWVTADTVTLRGIQANTMQEAARIANEALIKCRERPYTIDWQELVRKLEQAAIAIEKGEYKPV